MRRLPRCGPRGRPLCVLLPVHHARCAVGREVRCGQGGDRFVSFFQSITPGALWVGRCAVVRGAIALCPSSSPSRQVRCGSGGALWSGGRSLCVLLPVHHARCAVGREVRCGQGGDRFVSFFQSITPGALWVGRCAVVRGAIALCPSSSPSRQVRCGSGGALWSGGRSLCVLLPVHHARCAVGREVRCGQGGDRFVSFFQSITPGALWVGRCAVVRGAIALCPSSSPSCQVRCGSGGALWSGGRSLCVLLPVHHARCAVGREVRCGQGGDRFVSFFQSITPGVLWVGRCAVVRGAIALCPSSSPSRQVRCGSGGALWSGGRSLCVLLPVHHARCAVGREVRCGQGGDRFVSFFQSITPGALWVGRCAVVRGAIALCPSSSPSRQVRCGSGGALWSGGRSLCVLLPVHHARCAVGREVRCGQGGDRFVSFFQSITPGALWVGRCARSTRLSLVGLLSIAEVPSCQPAVPLYPTPCTLLPLFCAAPWHKRAPPPPPPPPPPFLTHLTLPPSSTAPCGCALHCTAPRCLRVPRQQACWAAWSPALPQPSTHTLSAR